MTFCYILPMVHLFQVPNNNQPAYWDSTCLGTIFSWWKCPDEIALCAHRSLPQDSLGRSLNEREYKKCTFKNLLHPISL